MYKITFTGIFTLFVLCLYFSCKTGTSSREKIIANTLLAGADSVNKISGLLLLSIEQSSPDTAEIRSRFLKTRLAYKKIEWATEYFEPTAARAINGPPVQEVETSGQVFEPSGLQVIESILHPVFDTSRKKELIRQLKIVQSCCSKFKTRFSSQDIFAWQIFDAGKLEVFRILTLGITGFDDPLSQNSMLESAAAIQGLQQALAFYIPEVDKQSMQQLFAGACIYLDKNSDFNSFDRMAFIRLYGNTLSSAITVLQEKLKIAMIRYDRLLNQDAKTLFDKNAFNVNAYSPAHNLESTPQKIELGKKLFADPGFSGNGRRSCASCHQPGRAFTDGMGKNTILDQAKLLGRNTPTLLNAALQPSLFYDARVNSLEDQSVRVMHSEQEMHGSITKSVQHINSDTMYHRLFAAAFPQLDNNKIDTFEVMHAISCYIRSLVQLNSRFDEYMQGNTNMLNKQEVDGFNLFMGKAKCGTCHYMPLFNGTSPPRYLKSEIEVIGVPVSPSSKQLDKDPGRYAVVKLAAFRNGFKTPTLRNIARTAPYMHNGAFKSLDEVMDFYEKGGGQGLGIKIDNQTLPFDKLQLSKKETADIIAFLKSLNSKD